MDDVIKVSYDAQNFLPKCYYHRTYSCVVFVSFFVTFAVQRKDGFYTVKLLKKTYKCVVLTLNSQDYMLFKISASGLFLNCS